MGGTLDALLEHDEGPLVENKQGTSMAKASTPEPVGPGPLWHTPGLHLPPYVQHVANDLKGTESERVRKAIGIVRNWAEGHDGNGHKVTPDTQAAAVKAMAEWEADKAKAHAHSASKRATRSGKVREELSVTESLLLADHAARRLRRVREAVGLDAMRGLVLLERDIPQARRRELAKKGLAFPDLSYPIENQQDLDNAWNRVGTGGRAKSTIVAHIKRAARKLKLKLPPGLQPVSEALLEEYTTPESMVRLHEQAAGWSPQLRRVASAPNEVERHEVDDGDQHVGTISRRRSYGPNEPDRFAVQAVNGDEIGGLGIRSQADALTALRKHLEEAPARVAPHRGGKFLVARPRSYGGATTYVEYPNEPTARHAAGLPARPTSPEQQSKVDAVAEMVTFDLLTLGGLAADRLREEFGDVMPRVPEGAHLVPLAERFNPRELRGFAGRWVGGGAGKQEVRVADPRPRIGGTDLRGRPRMREPLKPGGRSGTRARLSDGQLRSALRRAPGTQRAGEVASALERGTVADTESAYRARLPGGKLGPYSPERAQLHARIVTLLMQHAQSHPGRAEAVFMAGGPASGKSHLIGKGHVRLPADHVMVNPDQIRALLPEYERLRGRPGVAAQTHEEASHVSKLLANVAMAQRMHVVFDTTGNSGLDRQGKSKFAGKIERAIGAGYKTRVVYANVPTAVAERRSHERFLRTGRDVPAGYLRAAHADISARFQSHIRRIRGASIEVYDTQGKPKLIASKAAGSGRLNVRDPARMRVFTGKARDVSQGELAATLNASPTQRQPAAAGAR